jgi:hypothetical protein
MFAKPMESDPPARPKERDSEAEKLCVGRRKVCKNLLFSILCNELIFPYVSNGYWRLQKWPFTDQPYGRGSKIYKNSKRFVSNASRT